jgi:hypothetical protein
MVSANTRVLGRIFFQNSRGSVGAFIIDDDEFRVRERLIEDGVDASLRKRSAF